MHNRNGILSTRFLFSMELVTLENHSLKIQYKLWDTIANIYFTGLLESPTKIPFNPVEIQDPFLDEQKYEIDAKYIKDFLSALIEFQRYEIFSALINEVSLVKFLSTAVKAKLISLEEFHNYRANIPIFRNVRTIADDAHKKEGMLFAQIYRLYLPEESEYAIYWLANAFKENIFSKPINYASFLRPFKELSLNIVKGLPQILFQEPYAKFSEILAKEGRLTKITLNRYANAQQINYYFLQFIKNSSTLKILDLKNPYPFLSLDNNSNTQERIEEENSITDVQMKMLAQAIRFSTSLEELDISGHKHITDYGLFLLMAKFKENPCSSLRLINLVGTSVTEDGVQSVLDAGIKNIKILFGKGPFPGPLKKVPKLIEFNDVLTDKFAFARLFKTPNPPKVAITHRGNLTKERSDQIDFLNELENMHSKFRF